VRSRSLRSRLFVVTVVGAAMVVGACTPPKKATPPPPPKPASPLPPAGTSGFAFPKGVSANHRYLVDQAGKPYLVVGDSPQCMSTNLSTTDMDFFFADRRARSFNVAWVNLLCGTYTRGRADATTYDGIKPFTTAGDLATPNPAYFARMDTMVQLAAKHGITLFLDPAETGSFRDLLKSNGTAKSQAYGTYLGNRYKSMPNIVWMLGNDYQPDQWAPYDPYETALSRGIRAADPAKIQTIELTPESTSYTDPTWPPLVNLASAYTYEPTYDVVLDAYTKAPTQPVFMVEANYEFENLTGGPTTTDETLRRQEYWTMLSGATGQLYGNAYTWGLNDPAWKQHFDTTAAGQFGRMAQLFSARRWQDLVPDRSHTFATGGLGTYASSGDVLESDYATAAITADGALGMVYIPTARTVTINTARLKAGWTARWFDPTNGAVRAASAPYTTPGANAAGQSDWVLLFEAPGSAA